jgi:hypothetical protein
MPVMSWGLKVALEGRAGARTAARSARAMVGGKSPGAAGRQIASPMRRRRHHRDAAMTVDMVSVRLGLGDLYG